MGGAHKGDEGFLLSLRRRITCLYRDALRTTGAETCSGGLLPGFRERHENEPSGGYVPGGYGDDDKFSAARKGEEVFDGASEVNCTK